MTLKSLYVHEENGEKYLRNTGTLEIYYFSDPGEIVFLKQEVNFDKTGYFDPSAIQWDGAFALQRVADLLPYEYEIE